MSPTESELDAADRKALSAAIVCHVNERPVRLEGHDHTGHQIKHAAINQGVPIHEDFVLVEELAHGRTKVVGDRDVVHVTRASKFLANDGDDNS